MNKEFLKHALAKLDSMSDEELIQGLKDAGLEVVESTPASPSPAFSMGALNLPPPDIIMGELRITPTSIIYRGETVEDAGAVHRALLEVMNGKPLSAPSPARSDMLDAERAAFESWAVRVRVPYCDTPADRAQQWAGWQGRANDPAISKGMAESAPSGAETIATWRERLPEGAGWRFNYAHVCAMKAEIADLRAALARRVPSGDKEPGHES